LDVSVEVDSNDTLGSSSEFLDSFFSDLTSDTEFLGSGIEDLDDVSVGFDDRDFHGGLVLLSVFNDGFGVFSTNDDLDDVGNSFTNLSVVTLAVGFRKSGEFRDDFSRVLLKSVLKEVANVVFFLSEGSLGTDEGSEGLSELSASGEGSLGVLSNGGEDFSVLGIISEEETEELSLEDSLTGGEVLSGNSGDFSTTGLEFSVVLLGETKLGGETGVDLGTVESGRSAGEDSEEDDESSH
jgi:hypothetical protein